jgi:hypothetical protein
MEYIFPDLQSSSGRPLRFDFVIFDDDGHIDFIIEYQGKQHYEPLAKQLSKSKVQYIDFSAWFLSQKQKSKYSLMNKFGIHWTKYGEYVAMDSLINYMSEKFNWNLPKARYRKLTAHSCF